MILAVWKVKILRDVGPATAGKILIDIGAAAAEILIDIGPGSSQEFSWVYL